LTIHTSSQKYFFEKLLQTQVFGHVYMATKFFLKSLEFFFW